MYLNIIKTIYDKPIANIVFNGENLKPCPLKSRKRQGCLLPPLLLNIVLEFLARVIRQEEEKKNKQTQIDKQVVGLSPFADDMIFYLKDPNNSTQNS
jgi:hypothetical protein